MHNSDSTYTILAGVIYKSGKIYTDLNTGILRITVSRAKFRGLFEYVEESKYPPR